MNKVTKKELLERLDEIIKWFPRYQSPALQERRDEIDDIIRFLIENMDKKVKISREKFEKFYELSFGNNKKHVQEALLSEFGIETEEKEASDE